MTEDKLYITFNKSKQYNLNICKCTYMYTFMCYKEEVRLPKHTRYEHSKEGMEKKLY